ncbi:MAG: hypothetical protein JEZ03_03375 [Bacteroidales bacterium]|nr:hypothetical protein [Bacteroidales bacterium]
MENIKQHYQKLYNKYTFKRTNKQKQVKRLGFIRLMIFLLGILFLYITANINIYLLWVELFVFISSFILIIRKHLLEQKNLDKLIILEEINKKELLALNGDYSHFENGKEFNNPEHTYSDDLDVFGEGSMFQFLNRSSSIYGKRKLAHFLNSGLKDKADIEARQHATQELASKFNWRQKYMCWGKLLPDKGTELQELKEWMNEENLFQNRFYSIAAIVMPVLSFTMLFLLYLSIISFANFILYLFLVPIGITALKLRKVNHQHSILSYKATALKKYSKLLEMVEHENFTSAKLKDIQEQLTKGDKSAAVAIKRLSKLIDWLDHRLNMIMGFLLNAYLLWDVQIMRRIEQWKIIHREEIDNWFDQLGETDALCSLANYSYNHPDFVYPKILQGDLRIKSTDAGHPLIEGYERINNPINVEYWKHFSIITGANMAGKSTYLRTVGVNLILGMAGAPVCAKDFEFTPVDLFTSIRTKDNLQKHESYFYAELKRLKEIIDRIKNGQKLFIILDEILKGTNSKDKQSGSIAILKQLINLKSAGIIATHDLALGDLIKVYPEFVSNRCFEVEIINDKLDFDYKLKEGVAQNLNATFLMRKMGIVMDE